MDAGERPGEGGHAVREGDPRAGALEIATTAIVVGLLAWAIWRLPNGSIGWTAVFFALTTVVVDLIPVPGWGGMQLSLSFPILIGAAILFPPAAAGLIALVGSFDPREIRRQVTLSRAAWNRAQMAAAVLVGSEVFHLFATAT